MRKELKVFEYTCDGCNKSVTLIQERDELPDGWESKTEYDTEFEYCKPCYKLHTGL